MSNPNKFNPDSGESHADRAEYFEAVCAAAARAALAEDMSGDFFNSLTGTEQVPFGD
ncbi:MAG TPA: hypothetical protein VLF59_04455 [Candidatus Saccharimonadales bacterium]|nr:hypothetical protein [Candidatus Saccharimonadales bacterium]